MKTFVEVHHVIMYDFPLNMADYLHRVGRTARGGRAGRVTTITPRRYWPFVAKIQEATKEGKPIEVRNMSRKVKKSLGAADESTCFYLSTYALQIPPHKCMNRYICYVLVMLYVIICYMFDSCCYIGSWPSRTSRRCSSSR